MGDLSFQDGITLEDAKYGITQVKWNIMPVNGIIDTTTVLEGEYVKIAQNKTSNYSTIFPASNHKVGIKVNTITGDGIIRVHGAKVDFKTMENENHIEEIIIKSTGMFMTRNYFYDISLIELTGFSSINYDIIVLGGIDAGRNPYKLIGHITRLFVQSNRADFRLIFEKIKNIGTQEEPSKIEIETLEDIGFDSGSSGNQIIDYKRGTRNYNPNYNFIVRNNRSLIFRALDFDDYFQNEENKIISNKDEGLIIRIEGAPDGTGASAIDTMGLQIFLLPLNPLDYT